MAPDFALTVRNRLPPLGHGVTTRPRYLSLTAPAGLLMINESSKPEATVSAATPAVPDLSVVVPVKNEAENILPLIAGNRCGPEWLHRFRNRLCR